MEVYKVAVPKNRLPATVLLATTAPLKRTVTTLLSAMIVTVVLTFKVKGGVTKWSFRSISVPVTIISLRALGSINTANVLPELGLTAVGKGASRGLNGATVL